MEAFGWPLHSFDRRPYIMTLPILRLIMQGGYLAVGIFFVMSGYVCSIKPMKLARAGKPEEARKVIGSSAVRRLLRLGLPASIATCISFTIERLGGFNIARNQPYYIWLHFHTPGYMDWSTSVHSLTRSLVFTPQGNADLAPYLDIRRPYLEHIEEYLRGNSMDSRL
jgi:peptidoglycan/LPS O-acetylase OafA/YrhL